MRALRLCLRRVLYDGVLARLDPHLFFLLFWLDELAWEILAVLYLVVRRRCLEVVVI